MHTPPYDYLILLLANNNRKVRTNAIRFPKKAFQYIYNAISLATEEELDALATPYPIEVNQKMLECFEGEYMLIEQEPKNIWLSCIADIGEELWMYSKNRELLVGEEDKEYLSDNLNVIKKQINEIIESIKSSCGDEVLYPIQELCAKVYDGVVFGDEEYNELISSCAVD